MIFIISYFPFFSSGRTHYFYHKMATPLRMYYHITRWLFGYDYQPFMATSKNPVHPIIRFIAKHELIIGFFLSHLQHIGVTTLVIAITIYLIHYHFDRRLIFHQAKLFSIFMTFKNPIVL
jgi:hypothetical protein